MKTKIFLMFLLLVASNIFSQKNHSSSKWRITELDSLNVAQAMFDDQNFVMAFPFLNQLQAEHPKEGFLKYMTGICCLFKEEEHEQGLHLLAEVYKNNKKAEDIEFYLALAYHYNSNFDEAIKMAEKYLSKKHLNNAQKRSAEKIIEYCKDGKILEPTPDEGKLDDYMIAFEQQK